MTKLEWDVGQRRYEEGVDRGVLYFAERESVVWDGLIGVDENPNVSRPTPLYFDGIVYNMQQETPEPTLTVRSFTYPYMLEDHVLGLTDGRTLVGTLEENQPFGFTYRSMTNHGYKIHLVYNVVATIDSVLYTTVNESASMEPFSFTLHTSPVHVQNPKLEKRANPSSHLFVDTGEANVYAVAEVERILYGAEDSQPRFLYPSELIDIFQRFP